MQLERIKCTNCGGEFLEYDPAATIMRCDRAGCGATFRISQAKEFAKVVVDHEIDIRNLRQLLDDAMGTKDMDLSAKYAGEIRMLIPDDAYSAYCEALAQKKKGIHKSYHNFLKTAEQMTQQEAEKILDDALKDHNFTIHDEQPLMAFIAANFQEDLQDAARKQLEAAVDRLARLQNLHAIIPREVFICHSSSDPIARKVYEVLTEDGVNCWFSQVNLPDYTRNYWDHIKDAIRNCKIILVITSRDSMMREDPKREMGYAAQLGLHRLELKIDDTPHNTFFKYYFDGLQWIYLDEDVEKTFAELKRRVYELLHPSSVRPSVLDPVLAPPSTRALKVRYLDEKDQEINSQVINLLQGNHTIRPRADLVPEGYALKGSSEASVTVDAAGVSPGEIVFRYQSPQASLVVEEEKTWALKVRYLDEKDQEISSQVIKLLQGNHTIKPRPDLVPEGYALKSKPRAFVTVDAAGASPGEIVFRYQSPQAPPAEEAIFTRALKVRYLDERGQEISSQVINLLQGNHTIKPRADLVPEDYALKGRSEASVTVDAAGVSPEEIVFRYQSPHTNKPALVRLVYTYRHDNDILVSEERELSVGHHQVAPNDKKLPSEYILESSQPLAVKVEDGKASPEQLIFRCIKKQKPIAVTVHYKSENYKMLESSQELSFQPGEHKIYPAPKKSKDGYELITRSPIELKLEAGDAQKSVTFYYAKQRRKDTVQTTDERKETRDRIGWNLSRFFIILLLAGQALYVLYAFGVFDSIYRQAPVFMNIAMIISEETYSVIRDLRLPMMNLRSFAFTPLVVAYYAALNAPVILIFSMFFGKQNLRRTAEWMSRMLLFVIMPLNALYFWAGFANSRLYYFSNSQDKFGVFVGFMVPALVVLVLCRALIKIVNHYAAKKA